MGLVRRVPSLTPRRTYTLQEGPALAPPLGIRVPAWAYGAAASVAVLFLALLVSADLSGLLDQEASRPVVPDGALEATLPEAGSSETVQEAQAAGLATQEPSAAGIVRDGHASHHHGRRGRRYPRRTSPPRLTGSGCRRHNPGRLPQGGGDVRARHRLAAGGASSAGTAFRRRGGRSANCRAHPRRRAGNGPRTLRRRRSGRPSGGSWRGCWVVWLCCWRGPCSGA